MGNNNNKKQREEQTIFYKNKDKYVGHIVKGVREGHGVYYYDNGDRYDGWWRDDKRNGTGTLFCKNGALYVGEWENSQISGEGVYYYANGDMYKGHFSGGKRNGKGYFISSNNDKYIGMFKDNKKHGKGLMYFAKGKIAKEIWDEGTLVSCEFISDDEKKKFVPHREKEDDKEEEEMSNEFESGFFDEHIKYMMKKKNTADDTSQNKIITLRVAQYYKARIPNNYFDAMHIVIMTSDLIYENCHIIEWNRNDVLKWLERIGIEENKYDDVIKEHNIGGLQFLKMTWNELKEYKIEDVRDVKLILKSIDFLRIFVRLQMSYSQKMEQENKDEMQKYMTKVNSIEFKSPKKSGSNKNLDMVLSFHRSFDRHRSMSSLFSSSDIDIRKFSMHSQGDTFQLQGEDKDDFYENIENVTTKMAITKLLLHSLNLSGFYFYIEFNELKLIKKQIGKGGFGQVSLMLWNEKEVAVKKFCPKGQNNIKTILNKFIHEINIISNLRHPNIVLYIGASIDKDDYYLVTEYIPNGNFYEYLHDKEKSKKKIHPLTDQFQLQIAYEVAIAMNYLHSRNITHCDMKSSNILLDENFHVKISDFGLSRMVSLLNIEEKKGKFGTTQWMPPEIMKAKRYEEASDVFSYGMILWEMVTGEIPYCGLKPNQIVGLVADCRKLVKVPETGNCVIRKIIKECLNYFPEKRPTFEEIIRFIEKKKKHFDNHDVVTDEILLYIN